MSANLSHAEQLFGELCRVHNIHVTQVARYADSVVFYFDDPTNRARDFKLNIINAIGQLSSQQLFDKPNLQNDFTWRLHYNPNGQSPTDLNLSFTGNQVTIKE
jgi:hypothetical protein